jgi:hypothetical protein
VSLGGWDEHPFPFLRNPTALSTFQQLTRHVAHLSHTAEKELLALLRVRQDKWVAPKSNRAEDVVPNPNNSAAGAPAGTEPTNDEATIAGLPEPGSLDAALSDKRVLLPGEDEKAYEALARELWHDFGPTNLLEAFLVQDVIQTHWRLTRIGNLYHLVEEQGSRSTTGQECGLSFGFLQDSQGLGVSEILQQYEKVLQRRLEKRMALLRKVRTEGWTDNPVPFGDCGAAPCPADHPLAEKPSQVGNSNAAPTKTASGDQPQPLLDSAEPVATTSQPCGSTPATFDGRFRWLRRVADFWSSRWRS